MKRISMSVVAMTLGLFVLVAGVPQMSAQDTERDRNRDTDRSQVGELDDATRGANVRASQLTGMTIRNMEGENVGTVNDVVLGTKAGEIRYVAVSYGGFLGLGDELFAVPWEAFKVLPTEDGDDHQLVLDISQEMIKNAKGFDQDNWPNFGDSEYTRAIDQHYDIKRDPNQRTVAPSHDGSLDDATMGATIRASQLTGLRIRNPQDENLGTVHDIVIDGNEGKMRYVAVSYGGFLGLGNELFAVPWEAFETRHDRDRDQLVLILNVSAEKIKSAEGFDQNNWPDFGDEDFRKGLDEHYEIERRGDRDPQ